MNIMKSVFAACLLAVTTAYGNETRVCSARPGYEIITADLALREIVKYDANGKMFWRYNKIRAIDAWAMPDGSVLACYLPSPLTKGKGGVRLIGSDKATIFDFNDNDEIMGVQPLDNGNFLMAECKKGLITEMNLKGERISSFKVKTPPNGHKTMRRVRLSPKGTVWVNECYTNKLREYDRNGTLLKEFSLKVPTGTQPQPNGNLLISCWPGWASQLIELDPDEKTVWQLKAKELPEMSVKSFAEAIRLPNGNILTGASVSKTKGSKALLFEVTPEKKIVWKMTDTTGRTRVTSVKLIPSWPTFSKIQ